MFLFVAQVLLPLEDMIW